MEELLSDKNEIPFKFLILQLQLNIELSQVQHFISTTNDILFIIAKYIFLFETTSPEPISSNPAHTKFETLCSTPDPARDGGNWYVYCSNNPISFLDPDGLEDKPAVYPTVGNAFNLDFGRDYSEMAVQNFKNGHPFLGTIQMLDSACELVYDFAAAYGCANVIGAFIAAPAALPDKTECWLQSNGKPNYPPNNGAVLGTEVNQTLEIGSKIGRYGEIGPNSSFVTDTISTASELSLPPWTDPSTYQEFTVVKPIINVIGAEVEAWAGSVGGGTQYVLPQTIIQLQQEGYIK